MGHLGFAIALGDVVDHLSAALDAKVGINIRHRFAFRVQEPLKQQTVLDRINVGDAKGIGHKRARRRSPARSHRNPTLPGKADVIPHHKEVGRKTHLLHHLELKGQPFSVDRIEGLLGPDLEAMPQTLFRNFREIAHRGMALRDGEAGHLIAAQDVVGLHLLGHLGRVGYRFSNDIGFQVITKQGQHLGLTLDVFGACVAKPFFVADQFASEHTQQRVVGLHIVGTEVVGVVGGNQRDTELSANARHLHVDDAVFHAPVVLDLEVEVVAEDLLVPAGPIPSHIGPAPQDRLGDFPSQASRRHHQAFAVLLEQRFIDTGPRKNAPTPHPAQMADAGQLHQIAVTGGIFCQNHQVVAAFLLGLGVINGSIDDIHLIANDRFDPGSRAELEQLNGAVHHPVVGEGQGGHPKFHSPIHHRWQLGRPIQQAVIAVVVKRDEGQAVRRRGSTRLGDEPKIQWESCQPQAAHTRCGARARAPGQPQAASPSPGPRLHSGGPPEASGAPQAHW